MKSLGEKIRELRDAQDVSLREFARKLGDISPAHISDIENNRRFPSEELLAKMAQLLQVGVEELQKHDARPPVEDLKRIVQKDPAFGFALRKLAEKDVSAEDVLKLTRGKPDRDQEK